MRVLRFAAVVFFACSAYLTGPSLFAQNPVPLINQPLVPASAAPGGKGFTLTVNGTGFVAGAIVLWNDQTLATSFVSSARLTATVPATDIANAVTAYVSVENPESVSSNVLPISVVSPVSDVAFAPSFVPAGVSPFFVTPADVNRDGMLDMLETNGGSTSPRDYISVQLGKGDGTFQKRVNYEKAVGPPIVADFNGDGVLDFAATYLGSISIYLGLGNGAFAGPVLYPAGPEPFGLAAADLNRDGALDLVVENINQPQGTIILGNGDGTFQPPRRYEKPTASGLLDIGDFDRDGNLDVVITDQSVGANDVLVLLGNGDGTFQPAVRYGTGANPFQVVTADLNGDGILDLLTTNQTSSSVSVLLGNGDGTFQSNRDYSATDAPAYLTIADFNADGNLDVAVNSAYSVVSLLLGNGDGTFQSPQNFGLAQGLQWFVGNGDFDSNGTSDLIVPNSTGNTITMLQQTTLELSVWTLNFGRQKVGTSSEPQVVTLTNVGDVDLTISSLTLTGSDPADFSAINTCIGTLKAGSSCAATVTFSPTLSGSRSAMIQLSDTAAASPQSVTLKGNGVN